MALFVKKKKKLILNVKEWNENGGKTHSSAIDKHD